MNELHDPGGTVPQASNIVTVELSCSGMDTEGSIRDTDGSENFNSSIKRKRVSSKRICKHCNKKRRKGHKSSIIGQNEVDCQCILNNIISENTINKSHDQSPISSSTLHNLNTEKTHVSITRSAYQDTDVAPYIIHIQKEVSQPNDNVSLHPVSLGHFLKKNDFKNIINGSLKRIGRNRISLSFSKYEDANSFLSCSILKSHKYKAFIPSFNITRMGVVRGIPVNWSEDEILDNINVPIGCGKVIKVRRLNKKNIVNNKAEFSPIETVVLTFDGQVLPKRVFMCYNSMPVDLYIFPTIQCFNCCRYGHIKAQCRSSPKCYKCGQEHSGDNCSVDEDSVFCCMCSGSHFAINRKCPEFARQKSIKESMAKNCISYIEAVKLHPPITKLYTDALTSVNRVNTLHSSFENSVVSNSNNPKTTSYRKTVFRKPQTPPRSVIKGYNKSDHASLIKEYDIPLPSVGGGYNLNSISESTSLKQLILTLLNSLSQINFSEPTNAAISNDVNFNNVSHNGALSSDSMELQKHLQ